VVTGAADVLRMWVEGSVGWSGAQRELEW
jgi:hypothetical protein